jgi:hypothetical protein
MQIGVSQGGVSTSIGHFTNSSSSFDATLACPVGGFDFWLTATRLVTVATRNSRTNAPMIEVFRLLMFVPPLERT